MKKIIIACLLLTAAMAIKKSAIKGNPNSDRVKNMITICSLADFCKNSTGRDQFNAKDCHTRLAFINFFNNF